MVLLGHTARLAPEKRLHHPPAAVFSRGGQGDDMASSYWELLKHPEWQKRRLHMLDAAGWECEKCGAKEKTLHVHHKQYIKGRKPWEYEDTQLAVLCEGCHEDAHLIGDELKELLACIDNTEALALLRGFHKWNDEFDGWIGDSGRDRMPHVYALGIAAALLQFLRPDQLVIAVRFAVDCSGENSEARPLFERHGSIFKELG